MRTPLNSPGFKGRQHAALPILLCLLLAICWKESAPQSLAQQLARLGSEYGNIAASILTGKGFSNPFGYSSGPSAWMPPGVVAFYVAMFWLFGVKTYASACALLAFKALALCLTVGLLLLAARTLGLGPRSGLLVISVAALLGRYDWLRVLDLDESLIVLVSALTLVCLAESLSAVKPWHYALACGLPLVSPSLALGFVLVLLGRVRSGVHARATATGLLLALALGGGCWTLRNLLVLDRAIPIKSNLWFEFYLSNVATPNGLLCTETLVREHPIHPENSAQMSNLGEIATCDLQREKSWIWLADHPGSFVKKVAARAGSVFVLGYPSSFFRHCQPLSPADAAVLQKAELLWVNAKERREQFWLYASLPEAEARALLAPLPLQDREKAWQSWSRQMSERAAFARQPLRLAQSLAYSLLPTLGLLFALWRGGWRRQPVREAIILYLGYLLPYIVVSCLQRYQVAALALQVWLVWLAFVSQESPSQDPS
jgi:hypothetical protein